MQKLYATLPHPAGVSVPNRLHQRYADQRGNIARILRYGMNYTSGSQAGSGVIDDPRWRKCVLLVQVPASASVQMLVQVFSKPKPADASALLE